MDPQKSSDDVIEDWLTTLGVKSAGEWDTLIFLYRHHASLASAEHIARMLGYATHAIIDAVETLESLELVERSRTSQGVRLYQFIRPTVPTRGDAFDHLMSVADSRAIRLFLARKWRQRGTVTNTIRKTPHSPFHEGGKRKQWLKVM